MEIAAISTLILAYCLVSLALSPIGRRADHMRIRIGKVSEIGVVSKYDSEMSKPLSERFFKPAMDVLVKRLSAMFPKTKDAKLENSLKLAGIKAKPGEYRAIRLVVAFICAAAMALVAFVNGYEILATLGMGYDITMLAFVIFVFALGGALLGMIIMTYRMLVMTRTRKASIQKQLPEVLDLLSVSVEAGLGFDAALMRVTERAKGPLIEDLKTACREIALGRPRSEALRNFESRSGLDEVKTFVNAIIQAEQLGISLRNVLKAQAQQMRMAKRQRVEEKAMKAPVKIMIPMALFIFPVLFIILMGPAVINIINTFAG